MASLNIVAEYAKSGRSSCKKCAKTITANTLRLGLVSRDSRGFGMTRWHHFDCFRTNSESAICAEKIKGFSSLRVRPVSEFALFTEFNCSNQSFHSKLSLLGTYLCYQGSDQEALKTLVEAYDRSQNEMIETDKQDVQGREEENSNELIKREADGSGIDGIQTSDSKKPKMSTTGKEAEMEIIFSTSDVKNSYKDAALLPKWKAFQTVIFLERVDGLQDSKKIAAFDFDGCLAKTSVKRVGPDAWSLLYPSIPEKLRGLYDDGYKLVIFTNESNIERWKNKRQLAIDSKLGRLNNFIKQVKLPIQVFVACGVGNTGKVEDPFRKPKTGMWRIMEQEFNSGIAIDMNQSFYVGDAAGRDNDHSDADIKFAQALGLKFYVPEEYFGS